jgi:DNA-binding response OmpR family regulator
MTTPLLIRHGDLTIDLARYRVSLGYEPVLLSYREYGLLVFLATRAGHVVSRRRLMEEGMGRHDVGGLRMVDEHLRHLKSKLERQGEVFIEARDDGYRFLPPVSAPSSQSNV